MLPEADYGLTSMAMDAAQSRYNGDEFLLVKFFKHPRLNPQKSNEAGRPIHEETDYIQIMQPGNKDSIIIRPAMDMDKTRFAEHFRKYEAREDQTDLEGTLLADWAGITRSQVEELKFLNIRTVEQLANVSDSNAQNVMGIQFLKQKAVNYMEASKDDATVEALASAKAEIEELRAMVKAIQDGGTIAKVVEPDGDGKTPAPKAKAGTRRRKKATA